MAFEENLTVSRVRPGAVLAQDVHRADGSVLLNAGYRLTPDDIKILKTLGIQELVVIEDSTSSSFQNSVIGAGRAVRERGDELQSAFQPEALGRAFEEDLLRKYSDDAIEQATKCLEDATESFARLVHRLTCNLPIPAASFSSVWQDFQKVIRVDSAVALSTIANHNQDLASESPSSAIMTQGVMRAGLASVLASESGLDSSTVTAISTAAMVHDIALLEEVRPVVEKLSATRVTEKSLASEHSLFSAQIFSGLDGISDSVVNMIREVHEQIDGTGYPCNLSAGDISFGGRILNVVDAYVQMISDPCDAPYFPADALAHIVFHTKEGAFDREVVCHLLSAASIYPVGSPVALSDETDGIVYRAAGSDFTNPIVIVNNETSDIVDLRRTMQSIVRPIQDQKQLRSRRIKASSMGRRLWIDQPI